MAYIDPATIGGDPAPGKVITSAQAVAIITDIELQNAALQTEINARDAAIATLNNQLQILIQEISALQVQEFSTPAPVNTVLPNISGNNAVGSTITGSAGDWSNTPTSFVYQWLGNSVAISGATNTTYTLQPSDSGTNITFQVTAVNAAGNTTAISNVFLIQILAATPSNTGLPQIVGSNILGSTLDVSNGTWLNVPTSFSYQWNRNNIAINGATQSSYTIASIDQGTTLTCTITATNDSGSVTSTSAGVNVPAAGSTTSPNFTADTPGSGQVNVSYSYEFTASGTPAPTFSLASGNLPGGLTLNSEGLLSGTPTTTGSSNFVVSAFNSAGSVSTSTLTISISAPAGVAPTFTADNPPAGQVNVPYTYAFAANGTPTPTFGVTSGTLPAGLTLTNGILSGTPTTAQTASFVVTASNASGNVSTLTLVVVIAPAAIANSAPIITADFPGGGTVGVPYSYTFTATGNPTPIFNVSSGALPANLILSSSGLLSGTPSQSGTSNFIITASNSVASTSTSPLTVVIAAAPATSPPVNGQPPLISGTASVNNVLTASTGIWQNSPSGFAYQWNRNSVAILGATNSSYTIQNADAGTALTVTVIASNNSGSGTATSAAINIPGSIVPPGTAPNFTSNSPPGGTVNVAYSYTFGATGSTPLTFTSNGSLPIGLILSTSGVLSGTPTTVASSTFTVTVSNNVGSQTTSNITINIAASGISPVTSALDIVYGGNTIALDTTLQNATGVNYGGVHFYADSYTTWAALTNNVATLTSAGYITWLNAVSGRQLLISTGMVPSSITESTTVSTLGCLSGTGTGTIGVGAYDSNWPSSGSFQMEVRDAGILTELITVTAGSSTTITVTARGVGGSTAITHSTPTVGQDFRVPGAAGNYNTFWQQFGQALVALGVSVENAILRIGHEANSNARNYWVGPFTSTQSNWAAYYRQIVTTLNAIPGSNFNYEFNVNPLYSAFAPSGYYPGNSSVDYIGINQFDQTPTTYGGTAGQQWSTLLNNQGVCGLAAMMAFANTNSKPLAVSQWSLSTTANNGFGDDTTFIQNMYDIFNGIAPPNWAGGVLPQVAYQSYYAPTTNTGAINNGSFPNSLTLYKELFDTTSSGTIPVFTADSPPSGVAATPYSYQFTANGIPAATFAIASGSLPVGLILSSNGLLSGTPTTVGTQIFIISASNIAGVTNTPSLSVTINQQSNPQNAPTIIAAPVITGNNTVNSLLTASSGTWNGSPTSFSYTWLRNGVAISGESNVGNAYTLQSADAGNSISVTVTATNTAGNGTSTSAVISVPSGNPPVIVQSPTITGSTEVMGVLKAFGIWTGATSFTYQWYRNGIAISGATFSTYTVQTVDQNTTITCILTGINSAGSDPVSTPGILIPTEGAVVAPINLSAPTVTGIAQVGQSLSATTGNWSSIQNAVPAAIVQSPTGLVYNGGAEISGISNVISTMTLGNTLLLAVACSPNAVANILSVSGFGANWSKVATVDDANNSCGCLTFYTGTGGSGSGAATVNLSTSGFISAGLFEISNFNNLDFITTTFNGALPGAATTATTASLSLTPSVANDLMFVLFRAPVNISSPNQNFASDGAQTVLCWVEDPSLVVENFTATLASNSVYMGLGIGVI